MAKQKKERPDWIITKGQLSRYQKEQQRRRQIIIAGIVVVTLVVAFLIFAIVDSQLSKDDRYHQTVFKINDVRLDMDDYINELRLSGIMMVETQDQMDQMLAQTLYDMGNREQVRQVAASNDVFATDEEIDAQIVKNFSMVDSGTPLTENEAMEEYAKYIKALKSVDVPERYYRDRVATEVLIDKLKTKFVQIPPEEEQVHLRGILVDVAPTPVVSGTSTVTPGTPSSTSIEEVWAVIKARLDSGEDFAVLANEFSIDTGSAGNGGDLGWYPRGILNEEIEAVAFDLDAGVLSNPIPYSPDAGNTIYWIIEVTEHEQSRPLEESQKTYLENKAFEDWFENQTVDYTVQMAELDEEDYIWVIGKAQMLDL